MEDFGSPALQALLAAHAGAVESTHAQLGEATASVAASRISEVMDFLKHDPATGFDMLMDLTAVDYLGRRPRFEVVYHLYSIAHKQRLRIKAGVEEGECEIDSVVALWPGANWLEREVFDLYGIRFRGHPDLRRLLLYPEFEGHPLRKDYPKERRQPLVGPRN